MKGKGPYLALTLIVLALVLIAWLTPAKVNWTPTFDSKDKIPYGSYILHEQLKDIFPQSEISSYDQSFYNFGEDGVDSASSYLIVTGNLAADDLDVRNMTYYVASGNDLFISAYAIPDLLADTLGIEIKESVQLMAKDSGLYTASLKDMPAGSGYKFKDGDIVYWIKDADARKNIFGQQDDSARHSVVMRPRETLGTDASGRVNFARIPFGKGAFYIHLVPLAFTNYNMLKRNNNEYAARCLSYLSDGNIWWDQYYKPYHQEKAATPVRFLLSIPAYQWALYVAIFTAVFYMIFAGKRLQRIIPILAPPANLSLQFTRTVGTLYFQQQDHRDIAVKKLTYLLERIRQHYMISTGDLGPSFRERLAHKSNVDVSSINELFDIIDRDIMRTRFINEQMLISFNAALEKFYKDSGLINK